LGILNDSLTLVLPNIKQATDFIVGLAIAGLDSHIPNKIPPVVPTPIPIRTK
jgi:hypothetical protein